MIYEIIVLFYLIGKNMSYSQLKEELNMLESEKVTHELI